MNKLHSCRRIVINGGESLLDERLAVALALDHSDNLHSFVSVFRRAPTLSEVEDPTVIVLGKGDVYDVYKNTFQYNDGNGAFGAIVKAIHGEREFSDWYGGISAKYMFDMDIPDERWDVKGDTPVCQSLVKRLRLVGGEISLWPHKFYGLLDVSKKLKLNVSGITVWDLRNWGFQFTETMRIVRRIARREGVSGGAFVMDNGGVDYYHRILFDDRIDFRRCILMSCCKNAVEEAMEAEKKSDVRKVIEEAMIP